jgi:sirohydrochlorin cobaltochelatase
VIRNTEFGILIIGHGSREEKSNIEFESWVAEYQKYRKDDVIRFGYVELSQPDMKDALLELASIKTRIVLIPLFLFTSGHLKNDIPLLIHQIKPQYPEHQFLVSSAIGIKPEMIQILLNRVSQFMSQSREEQKSTGVIVIGRGSSDVDANGDFYKLVRFFEEGNSYSFVLPAFIGITRPSFEDALERAARLRPDRLLVVPYFLFGGRLIQKIHRITHEFSTQYSWIKTAVTPYIGSDPTLFKVADEMLLHTLTKTGGLLCVTCQYRTQMPGMANQVSGVKAMLWSLRHRYTHTQAGSHPHSHQGLKKHIFVCENVDCAGRGSLSLTSKMRRLIKTLGKQREFRITRTSCMGRCGEGPVLAIYPDGIWYRKVQEDDIEDLVYRHLMNDEIVTHCIDEIMQ